jgi:hypothetical protein
MHDRFGPIWLWIIGVLVSLLVIAACIAGVYTDYYAQKPPHIAFYVITIPLFVNFSAICLAGFLYEVLLKHTDRRSYSMLIGQAVRHVIHGRDPSHVDDWPHDLTEDQVQLRDALLAHSTSLHALTVNTFLRRNKLTLYEFNDTWNLLLRRTFLRTPNYLISQSARMRCCISKLTNFAVTTIP